jgi:8-oxo-dGTP diphosphatase
LEGARPKEAEVLVSDVVRAGGGVALRLKGDRLETVLVHRPKYDDWSLPKGKVVDPEDEAETAVREVQEETGLVCDVGPELPAASYRDASGRAKLVRYWLMQIRSGARFSPGTEVDRIEWMPVDRALTSLTYERDREVLRVAVGLAEPLYLLRHAKAESRAHWNEDDALRPLSSKGRRQAERLIDVMAGTKVRAILSSPSDRCRQTVEPLAEALGLEVEIVAWLDEGTPIPVALNSIQATAGPVVLCSHGDVITGVILHLTETDVPVVGPLAWKKGSTWVLERDTGVPSRLRYEPPPRDRESRGA